MSKTAPKPKKSIDTILKMSAVITSSRYIEEILSLITGLTAEMMNSKICSIMLLDDTGTELEIKATQALSKEYLSKPNLKVGQSISGLAVKEKRPITVLDVTKERLYMYPDIAKKEGLKSLLSVPMMLKDKVIGVVNSYMSKEHNFTDEEIKLLQIVAHQAAIAIENTKLLNKTLAMEQALDTRKSVERAKGVLMKRHGISEEEAFKIIQKQSMNTRRTMKEIADAVILASEIKP